MSSKKIDFDFSKNTKKPIPVVKKKTPSATPKEEIPETGILLTIPTEKKNVFISRDLAMCTTEELDDWITFVMPGNTKIAHNYRTINKRVELFATIVKTSQIPLLSPKQEDPFKC